MSVKIDQSKLGLIFERDQGRFVEEWKELLSFPSISIETEYQADCQACAEWLGRHLQQIGFKSELLETSSKPVVFAEYTGRPGKKTVLFYGHYDVQPVDPLDLWQSEPFSPELRDGRIYARGAQDNKGQLFAILKALEVLIREGALECSVKLLLEGEEECGSAAIRESLPQWRSKIGADVLMVCDTGFAAPGIPAIVVGLRGLVGCTVWLGGLTRDLHSGMHGGLAPNPARELAVLLASLHQPDGSVAVKGFYDGVLPVSAKERELLARTPFDASAYKREIGVDPLGGEVDLSPNERVSLRPTLDVNGIHSGYGGAGQKTIIPSEAFAKLTARLVAGQDPHRVLDLILAHLRENAPSALQLKFSDIEIAGPAVRRDVDGEVVQRAVRVLSELCGCEPVFGWCGASIPIVADLAEIIGEDVLLVGFGLDENNIHAPNENFSIEQFKCTFLYGAMMLQELGK
ncbi:MAG: dipeptidase [Deltaproteobacteria bacterium]|mgnify:CR=1 FL=1|nr:dipeptidase [Deltaproteobacteria bacterium]